MELEIALHQGLGGVDSDTEGRTNIPALYVCGEAAGGVQGRTRAMGTGLLEARIFGLRAAEGVLADLEDLGTAEGPTHPIETRLPKSPKEFEKELDSWLGPLTHIRPEGEVRQVLSELEEWPLAGKPTNGGGPPTCASWFAGLRREAAVAILASELESSATP